MSRSRKPSEFTYERWRHGGWYVTNIQYPSGAIGCVSRNYPDHKWRIACDPRPFDQQPTFSDRDAAARGERELIAREFEFEALERAKAETDLQPVDDEHNETQRAWLKAYAGGR